MTADTRSGAGPRDVDLDAAARRVIDENVYLTLGTADADGQPWTSPVFFAHEGYRDFIWMSSPEVTHSVNLAARPEVSIVLFDSRAVVGTGGATAVYVRARASEVGADELAHALDVYPGPSSRGGRPVAAADLTGASPYRLYLARTSEWSMLCPRPAGEPCAEHGMAVDHRTAVHPV